MELPDSFRSEFERLLNAYVSEQEKSIPELFRRSHAKFRVEDLISAEPNNFETIIFALLNQQVIGLSTLSKTLEIATQNERWELSLAFIESEYRGNGYGEPMLRLREKIVQKNHGTVLMTYPQEKLIPHLKAEGYEQDPFNPGYFFKFFTPKF